MTDINPYTPHTIYQYILPNGVDSYQDSKEQLYNACNGRNPWNNLPKKLSLDLLNWGFSFFGMFKALQFFLSLTFSSLSKSMAKLSCLMTSSFSSSFCSSCSLRTSFPSLSLFNSSFSFISSVFSITSLSCTV